MWDAGSTGRDDSSTERLAEEGTSVQLVNYRGEEKDELLAGLSVFHSVQAAAKIRGVLMTWQQVQMDLSTVPFWDPVCGCEAQPACDSLSVRNNRLHPTSEV